ncbi:MAG: CarD family transcriptional regulator [Bacillota bacterium]|nr:CarD family transcriptional regulator [Bacillota bacterium]
MAVFNVGDKVVYPMHGAGVIEAVEEREVLGERQKYYILRIPLGDMRVMVPLNNAREVGLRSVISEEDVKKVYEILGGAKTKMSSNWNRRYRANLEKMKSGDVFAVAEVVRNLAYRDREKGLSTGERRMLDNAKQILISELVIAQEAEEAEVQKAIEEVLQ